MAAAAPTGCFKCGRVGHWSRDCPFEAKSTKATAPPPPAPAPKKKNAASAAAAPAKSRKRVKLTADLVLSDKGLGHVLEKIPHTLSVKGRGHEAEDLGSFLSAYKSWHAKLFPSLSFKRFVDEVENIGTVKRVRMCLEELRDKVADGVNLKDCSSQLASQSQSYPADHDIDHNCKITTANDEDPEAAENHLFNDILGSEDVHSLQPSPPNDEQKARMEANRLKALERARGRLSAASGN